MSFVQMIQKVARKLEWLYGFHILINPIRKQVSKLVPVPVNDSVMSEVRIYNECIPVRYGRIGLFQICQRYRKCAKLRRNKCSAYSERQTPPLVEEQTRFPNTWTVSERTWIGSCVPTGARSQEVLCWRGPAAIYRSSGSLTAGMFTFVVCLFMFCADVNCFFFVGNLTTCYQMHKLWPI
jgi:hypothetical protein